MKTILLVEDYGPLRRAVARQLMSHYDVEVSQVSEAHAARSALARRDYDIILTDYDLGDPELTGIWLLGKIPNSSHTVKCLTSSYHRNQLLLPDSSVGIIFFRKPLNVEEFARVVGLKKDEG